MPEQIQYEDDDLFNPETAHEHSDVPVRPLLKAIVLFIVFGVATHFMIKFMHDRFAAAERGRMDPPQTAVAVPADVSIPKKEPLLQPFPHKDMTPDRNTPVTDLIDMRAAEDKVLHGYAWIDKEHGTVSIPIAEAKKLLVARSVGTPASPPAEQAASTPPVAATTTDSGAHQ